MRLEISTGLCGLPFETHAPEPVRSRWPVYDELTIADVVAVLRSGRVNALHHGENCRAFEQAFARLCDVGHAISLANGTLALELALRAVGIGPGDEVVVPARSFMASASCVRAVGARPRFADVDADTQTLTAATIAAVLTPRTRAVIPVHLAGWPAPMDGIMALARQQQLQVIEDCAQAHGAKIGDRPVGSFGDAACFSFCTDKIISTGGEGGMLVTPDEEVWRRAWSYKDHGKLPDGGGRRGEPGVFRWLHESFGSNYRMTEMQAAIGLRQLAALPVVRQARQDNAAILNEAFADVPALRLTVPPPPVGHAFYKYYCFVRPERLRNGWSRDRILAALDDAGVPCGSGSCPEIYRENAFRDDPARPGRRLPVSRMLGETSLMFPVDPTLGAHEMHIIAARTRAVMEVASC